MHEIIRWRRLHLRRPVEPNDVAAVLRKLASQGGRRPVVFETRARDGEIEYLLGAVPQAFRGLSSLLESLLPGASLADLDRPRTPLPRTVKLAIKPRTLSLDTSDQPAAIRQLLYALISSSGSIETATQLILGSGIPPRRGSGSEARDPSQGWVNAALHGPRAAATDVRRDLNAKQHQHAFNAELRVATSADPVTARLVLSGVLSAIRTMQSPGLDVTFIRDRDGALDDAVLPVRWPLTLTESEALPLLGWPLGDGFYPGVPNGHPNLLPATAAADGIFATGTAPATKVPIGLTPEGRRHHTVLLGPTGAGKSSIMIRLALDDFNAGRSVAVLDPQANLIRDLLERIPAHRRDDVVVLDPSDIAPVGLNPLVVPGTPPELVADSILGTFKDLFGSSFGPRTTDVMHASLLTLAHHGQASLVWLPRLLTDPAFRRTLTVKLNDPIGLEPFWAQFDALPPAQQAQVIAPSLSRLRQLLLRPSLRRVLGQVNPKFQISDLFARPRILLVAVNKSLLGPEAAKLLGSLLVSSLWSHALAQGAIPERNRRQVSIYLDEAQDFLHLTTVDLPEALARSRAMKVGWVLAHQYRSQMPDTMLAAIDTNARNKIIFGLSPEDANALAKHAPELEPADFQALGKHEIYTRLVVNGAPGAWMSGMTLPPPPATSSELELRARSQSVYGATPTDEELGAPPNDVEDAGEALGRQKRGVK